LTNDITCAIIILQSIKQKQKEELDMQIGRRNREVQSIQTETPAQSDPRINSEKIGHEAAQAALRLLEGGFILPDSIDAEANSIHLVDIGDEPGLLITDTRENKMSALDLVAESEADYIKNQERLNQPLSENEVVSLTDHLTPILRQEINNMKATESNQASDRQLLTDLERTLSSVIGRITNGAKGGNLPNGSAPRHEDLELGIYDRLVKFESNFGQFATTNGTEESNRWQASNGGWAEVDPQSGEIHCRGYNGSILFDTVKAITILDGLKELDPKEARLLLEGNPSKDIIDKLRAVAIAPAIYSKDTDLVDA
jgi:hypothetical protein